MADVIGNIHSIETCGTVDGPGIRFVVFLQGCPLRCKYCHNPDTWKPSGGTPMSANDVFKEALKYKSYMKFSNGGITVTGGEPLLQLDFLDELFKKCKEANIHTAIDTSGYIFNDKVKELLNYTDLTILDIKNYDKKQYKYITGVSLDPTLDFLNYLREINKPVWLRYVLVPELSDNLEAIEALGQHINNYTNIEKIEILPFHKMGEYKWKELGLAYELEDINEPSKALLNKVLNTLSKYHPNVVTS